MAPASSAVKQTERQALELETSNSTVRPRRRGLARIAIERVLRRRKKAEIDGAEIVQVVCA
jgi:hypothetical protein